MVHLSKRQPEPTPESLVKPNTPPVQPPPDDNADQAKQALSKELDHFLVLWIQVYSKNNLNDYVPLYADHIDYQYVDGREASRQEVINDIAKNVNRWPNRNYTVRGNNFKWGNQGDNATLSFILDYNYTDGNNRRAIGSTSVDMTLRRSNGSWAIIRFREDVNRVRTDKK